MNSEYTGVAVLLTVRIRLQRIGFLLFSLCWGTVQLKSYIQLLTGALKHIYIYLSESAHQCVCTKWHSPVDLHSHVSPRWQFRCALAPTPTKYQRHSGLLALAKYTTPYDTTTRKNLLHNPCTKPISSCLTLFCVFKPTMYAAFGTTKAIQALSQNGNREESVLAKQSGFYFLFFCMLLTTKSVSWAFWATRKDWKSTNFPPRDSNEGTDTNHTKTHMLWMSLFSLFNNVFWRSTVQYNPHMMHKINVSLVEGKVVIWGKKRDLNFPW